VQRVFIINVQSSIQHKPLETGGPPPLSRKTVGNSSFSVLLSTSPTALLLINSVELIVLILARSVFSIFLDFPEKIC
jgi:hypothetical protein